MKQIKKKTKVTARIIITWIFLLIMVLGSIAFVILTFF